MKVRSILLSLFLAAPAAFGATADDTALSESSLSPDGAEIAFVSGGDIWTVPSDGGEARLLVAHPANDSRPLYSLRHPEREGLGGCERLSS